jgi:hypothetical protein
MNTTTAGQPASAHELVASLWDRVQPLAALSEHIVNGSGPGDGHALACGVLRLHEDLHAVQRALGDPPAGG